MSDGNKREPRGSAFTVWLVVALLLLPALYVLSIGPAASLFGDSPHKEIAIAFYSPLESFARKIPVLDALLGWYVSLWP
jgi:hypothetical protein